MLETPRRWAKVERTEIKDDSHVEADFATVRVSAGEQTLYSKRITPFIAFLAISTGVLIPKPLYWLRKKFAEIRAENIAAKHNAAFFTTR